MKMKKFDNTPENNSASTAKTGWEYNGQASAEEETSKDRQEKKKALGEAALKMSEAPKSEVVNRYKAMSPNELAKGLVESVENGAKLDKKDKDFIRKYINKAVKKYEGYSKEDFEKNHIETVLVGDLRTHSVVNEPKEIIDATEALRKSGGRRTDRVAYHRTGNDTIVYNRGKESDIKKLEREEEQHNRNAKYNVAVLKNEPMQKNEKIEAIAKDGVTVPLNQINDYDNNL